MARKTVGTQSVSGPSQPSKAKPSVEYSQNRLGTGRTKTVTDGTTSVKTSVPSGAITVEEWDKYGAENIPPCINPSCRSFGKPHPNCLCYAGPGGSSMEGGMYSEGGTVCSHKMSHHESCEHYADGGAIESNNKFLNDPQHVLDHVVAGKGLLDTLTKVSRSKNPHAHFYDYMDGYKKGGKSLDSQMKGLLEGSLNVPDPTDETRNKLKEFLATVELKPEKLLDIGGDIGNTLPNHATQLGALAGISTQHLNALKPKPSQPNPLDDVSKPTKYEINKWNRRLDIAQDPMLILKHVKNGTVLPSDLATVQTLYPKLLEGMKQKAMELLIDKKHAKSHISYKHRLGLNML